MRKLLAACVISMAFAGGAVAQQKVSAPQAARPAVQPSAKDVDPNSIVMAALQTTRLIDEGKGTEVWDGSSPMTKRAIGKSDFVKSIATSRAPLGQPVSRVWLSVIRQAVAAPQAGTTPPAGSAPPGDYISIRFATRFSGGKTMAELVTFRLEDNTTWRVAGYTLQ